MATFTNLGFQDYQELRQVKVSDLLARKQSQQLRATNHELRQLERQIQTAMVSKQLREQQELLAQKKECERRTRCDENLKFATECEQIRKSMREKKQQDKYKQQILFESIKRDINDRQQKRQIEFLDIRKDCDEMGKILEQMNAEKIIQRREQEFFREECKKEMESAYHNIKMRKQLENDKRDYEFKRNLEYQKESERLKSQMATERIRTKEKEEELKEQFGHRLAIINCEKQNRENLLLSLSIEERKAIDEQKYRETLVKRIEKRRKFRMERDLLLEENKNRKEMQFKMEEEKFLKEHLRFLEERDKIDQLSDERRHRKRMEHTKDLREMLKARRCQKAKEIATRIVDFEKAVHDVKKSNQLIEEERMRMLNDVPKELLRYLPPGVLKPSDKDFLLQNDFCSSLDLLKIT